MRLGNTNRTLRFADPITRVLSEYATIIPCNPLAPVRWFMDGIWFCTHPEVEICTVNPKQLPPGPYQCIYVYMSECNSAQSDQSNLV